jgi:hypothetical protein
LAELWLANESLSKWPEDSHANFTDLKKLAVIHQDVNHQQFIRAFGNCVGLQELYLGNCPNLTVACLVRFKAELQDEQVFGRV